MDNNIKLSILILTIPRRLEIFFPKLVRKIEAQIKDRKDIEIVGIYDNKKRSVGAKRNMALYIAQGKYLTFIDDDDDISDDYIESIMSVIDNNDDVDCIVFDCMCTTEYKGQMSPNGPGRHCKYGIEYDYWQSKDGHQWTGKPAHSMVYSSKIAKKHMFPEKNYGEDVNWVVKACADIKKQSRIDKILYFYNFRSDVTETRS